MSRIALYLGLIDGVLAYNSEKIAEARVKEILAGLHGPHPILKRLEVYRDLTLHSGAVGYADIPDKERTMAALQALLEEYYQELVALTDEDTAAERMRKPVKDYLSARWNEVVATRIDWYLPNLTLLDLRREKKDLASLSRGDRSKLFFETVLTAYVMDLAQTITVSTYQKKLAILKKDITAARAMILSKTGSVSINIPADDPNVVQDLCHVFNAFVDLTAFTLGEEGAAEKAQHLLSPVIDFFSPLPDKIGATDHFIYGRLSSSLPSHIPGMNATIGGGFPRGAVILFQVPSGIERNILWTHLLKDALALKGSLVAVVTTRFPKDVRNDLEHVGTKTQKLEAKNKMVFVDWYSHKNERIVGIDVSKTVVKSGKDLTNLEIGLETGIGILSNNNVGRVFFDSISAIIKGFDSKSSYSFFQSLRKKVAEKNMVAMVFVEKEMHDQKTLSWLHQVFDGVVDVSTTDHGSTIRTLSFRGRSLKTTPYSLTLSMDEVSIDEGKHKGMDKQAILDLIEKHKVKVVEAPAKEKVTREARTKEEHYRLAVELSSKREHEKAKKEFQKAIEIDDKYEDAYQALGAMLLYGTSELDEAISALEKVVALNPENGDAWFDIGNARYKKKMVYEAKNAFLFALKVKPYYRWYNGKEFICPSCTTILSVGTRRCMGCGTELDVTGKAKSPSTSEKGGMLETAPIKEPTPTPAAMPKEEGEVGTEIEIDGLEI
ncbi:MAG: hypothetical protein KAT70_08910, partial [Thermoplasmata archaeon]|nr:hypothetical protein [Thermoplasmata archaeon]